MLMDGVLFKSSYIETFDVDRWLVWRAEADGGGAGAGADAGTSRGKRRRRRGDDDFDSSIVPVEGITEYDRVVTMRGVSTDGADINVDIIGWPTEFGLRLPHDRVWTNDDLAPIVQQIWIEMDTLAPMPTSIRDSHVRFSMTHKESPLGVSVRNPHLNTLNIMMVETRLSPRYHSALIQACDRAISLPGYMVPTSLTLIDRDHDAISRQCKRMGGGPTSWFRLPPGTASVVPTGSQCNGDLHVRARFEHLILDKDFIGPVPVRVMALDIETCGEPRKRVIPGRDPIVSIAHATMRLDSGGHYTDAAVHLWKKSDSSYPLWLRQAMGSNEPYIVALRKEYEKRGMSMPPDPRGFQQLPSEIPCHLNDDWTMDKAATVDVQPSERDVILQWMRSFFRIKPHVLVTYNGDTFDILSIITRAQELGISMEEISGYLSYYKHLPIKRFRDTKASGARGVVRVDTWDFPGTISVDMYPYMRTKYPKLQSWKLGAVCAKVLDKRIQAQTREAARLREMGDVAGAELLESMRPGKMDNDYLQMFCRFHFGDVYYDTLYVMADVVAAMDLFVQEAPWAFYIEVGQIQGMRPIDQIRKMTMAQVASGLNACHDDLGYAVMDLSSIRYFRGPMWGEAIEKRHGNKFIIARPRDLNVDSTTEVGMMIRRMMNDEIVDLGGRQLVFDIYEDPDWMVISSYLYLSPLGKGKGGHVIEPSRGLYHEFIATLDFASLYPSIMKGMGCCYSSCVVDGRLTTQLAAMGNNIDGKEEGGRGFCRLPDGNVMLFDPLRRGILGTMVSGLLSSRQVYKDLLKTATGIVAAVYKMRELALKLIANGTYGAIYLESRSLGEVITAYGRVANGIMRKCSENPESVGQRGAMQLTLYRPVNKLPSDYGDFELVRCEQDPGYEGMVTVVVQTKPETFDVPRLRDVIGKIQELGVLIDESVVHLDTVLRCTIVYGDTDSIMPRFIGPVRNMLMSIAYRELRRRVFSILMERVLEFINNIVWSRMSTKMLLTYEKVMCDMFFLEPKLYTGYVYEPPYSLLPKRKTAGLGTNRGDRTAFTSAAQYDTVDVATKYSDKPDVAAWMMLRCVAEYAAKLWCGMVPVNQLSVSVRIVKRLPYHMTTFGDEYDTSKALNKGASAAMWAHKLDPQRAPEINSKITYVICEQPPDDGSAGIAKKKAATTTTMTKRSRNGGGGSSSSNSRGGGDGVAERCLPLWVVEERPNLKPDRHHVVLKELSNELIKYLALVLPGGIKQAHRCIDPLCKIFEMQKFGFGAVHRLGDFIRKSNTVLKDVRAARKNGDEEEAVRIQSQFLPEATDFIHRYMVSEAGIREPVIE